MRELVKGKRNEHIVIDNISTSAPVHPRAQAPALEQHARARLPVVDLALQPLVELLEVVQPLLQVSGALLRRLVRPQVSCVTVGHGM